jgi:hypothetical protein
MNDQILKYCNDEVYSGRLKNANDECRYNRLRINMEKLENM